MPRCAPRPSRRPAPAFSPSSASARPAPSARPGAHWPWSGRRWTARWPDHGDFVIAYEPVWAIGTGLTPTPADVAEVHGHIRARLSARFGAAGQGVRILYGGSVKPANAKELLTVADVDGALVGGASLVAADFLAIAGVYG